MSAVSAAGAAGGVVEGLLTMASMVLVCLLVAGYGRGVQELWRRGAVRLVPPWRVAAFGAGLLTVLAAEHGPMHALAEGSFAGHMTQHMMFLLGSGPLLAAGAAGLPLSLATPLALRRRLARWRVGPGLRWTRRPVAGALVAGAGQAVVLWFWHLPGAYVAAVDHPVLHAAEHLCFAALSWSFWSPMLGAARHRPPVPVAVLLLAGTMLPASALGAVLTFAPQPVYPLRVFGADPLADQQLAGLLMWAPMDVVVILVSLGLFLRWLIRLDQTRPDGRRPVPAGRAGAPLDAEREGAL
ncbi:cytochrome c oxidase assembly protein [Micromonospora sp. NPDC048999]|uniref:cytochrome c oxidase assembly protein n=1 Tax=Micromonospora sp. NPDC048999 TaxID=3155391 RepID=UPI0033DC3941